MATLIEELNEMNIGRSVRTQRETEATMGTGVISKGWCGLVLIAYEPIEGEEDGVAVTMASVGRADDGCPPDWTPREDIPSMLDALAANSSNGWLDLQQVVFLFKPPSALSQHEDLLAQALYMVENQWPGPVVFLRDDESRPGELESLLSTDVVASGRRGGVAISLWWNPITENGIISGGIEADL